MKTLWFFPIIICFLICGCAEYWYQDGKTFDQCRQDRDECFAELKKRTDFGGTRMDYELKYMEACMTEKGYRLVKEKDLPLDARRQEPDTSMDWRTKGLAGRIK